MYLYLILGIINNDKEAGQFDALCMDYLIVGKMFIVTTEWSSFVRMTTIYMATIKMICSELGIDASLSLFRAISSREPF